MVKRKLKCLKRVTFEHATVHPIATPRAHRPRVNRIPYGSWCLPNASEERAHPPVRQTNSNVETSKQLYDDAQEIEGKELSRIIKLFSTHSLPPYSVYEGKRSPSIELEYVQQNTKRKDSSQIIRIEKNLDAIAPASPQSPVPYSPKRQIKCRGFLRLPYFCDPSMPIDPQGSRYICWLLVVTFCYSYNAWCIALRATFPYQTSENTPYWMIADYLCDLVYLLDVALVKPRLMFLHEGFWVDDTGETRKNYRKKLQYKYDVISLLPLDLLYIIYGAQKVILRFPRVLKLQTFWEFHQAIDRVLSSPYVVRIGKTLFYIFYLIHLNACAYYAVSYLEGIGSNGWVYDGQGSPYIRCFYFATKTATSIGKNPRPENNHEYLFMTVAWLMGVFVFALLIGQIRDIIATATRAKAEYRKHVDGCSRYLRKLSMPQELQRRVTAWFTHTWNQQRCFNESRILNSLPINMKRDVALAVHMSTLSKVQIFRDCSSSLLRDLVLQLKAESFLPGDAIVRRGDVGHHMYIIKSGECYVMSLDENEVLATLREGSVFGEISLLGIDGLRRRTATVRSRGYSNLFALSKNDLDGALKHHKEAAIILRRRADQMIRENAARQAEKRMAERQVRQSASIAEDDASVLRLRRLSNVSSTGSSRDIQRQRVASFKGKLTYVDEVTPNLYLACSGIRTPVPTIIFTSN